MFSSFFQIKSLSQTTELLPKDKIFVWLKPQEKNKEEKVWGQKTIEEKKTYGLKEVSEI